MIFFLLIKAWSHMICISLYFTIYFTLNFNYIVNFLKFKYNNWLNVNHIIIDIPNLKREQYVGLNAHVVHFVALPCLKAVTSMMNTKLKFRRSETYFSAFSWHLENSIIIKQFVKLLFLCLEDQLQQQKFMVSLLLAKNNFIEKANMDLSIGSFLARYSFFMTITF